MQRRAFLIGSGLLPIGAATAAQAGPRAGGFQLDGQLILGAYQALVEEHFGGVLRAIKALAVTSDAQTGRWASIRPALRHLSQESATYATAWFAQPDGSYAGTASDGPAPGNLADRKYFAELMGGGHVEGTLVVSKSTGHQVVIIATPVFRRGEVIAAIGVSIQARMISELVSNSIAFPDDVLFYALNPEGQAAIHKDPAKQFQHPFDAADPGLKSAIGTILSEPQGTVSYKVNKTHATVLFNRSSSTGWRFVLVKVHA